MEVRMLEVGDCFIWGKTMYRLDAAAVDKDLSHTAMKVTALATLNTNAGTWKPVTEQKQHSISFNERARVRRVSCKDYGL